VAYYTCSIGSHTFEGHPDIEIETDEIVRTNVTPNRLVARNYRWLVKGRINAATPADTKTALLSLMTACVNPASGVLPTSFKILDASAAAVAQIGDVRTGTSEEWEDIKVTSFRLLDKDEAGGAPLVADAQFEIGFSARRSFPDANGVCELFQTYRDEPDEFGNTVRNLTTTEIRLAKSSANTIAGTAAITAQLKLDLPTGWRRTRGDLSRGFTIEYLDYPLLHRARCESEVTRNGGSAGTAPPTNAILANTGKRTVDDPEKGVRRIFHDAETVGSTVGLTWVEAVRPTDATGEIEERPEEKTYRGKWQRLEPLGAAPRGKVTRDRREFVQAGGEREGGAILMSPPHVAYVSRGPRSAVRVVETVRVYALGVTGDADIPLPEPLGAPWLLVEPVQYPKPVVDEDSLYPEQRLWLRSATREYLWGGAADDPALDTALAALVFADASVVF
jgi:hypothetical protein